MDWVRTIVDSLKWIEDNLENSKINAEIIAEKFYISSSHYQRAFNILTGITVSEYVRNRKLSIAATNLLKEGEGVLETSLRYGYETPEAFCKAFKRFHGINPSEVKKGNLKLRAFPPLQLKIVLKGEKSMDYKIVKKEAFKLVGKSIEVSMENGENIKMIPTFWNKAYEEGWCQKLSDMSEDEIMTGACIMPQCDCDNKKQTFTYAISTIIKSDSEIDKEFEVWDVESHNWAIFECLGAMPHAITDTFHRIFSEWFPATGFEHADAPELEVYFKGDLSSEEYKSQIWVPIIKKD